ncbi:MAG: hypothetical protein DMF82_06790 [Acidobacteria bacterium]|nr:MAG: hypothetical protein DMF82_06790 [Acidobacteriota bacterium]
MPKKARAGARRERTGRAARRRHWSGEVTRRSSALALEPAVFKQGSSRAIAASLKRSADRSRRRKAGPYQSAMSMLNFYVNRAGRSLSGEQKTRLEKAKQELRRLYGRDSTRGQAR